MRKSACFEIKTSILASFVWLKCQNPFLPAYHPPERDRHSLNHFLKGKKIKECRPFFQFGSAGGNILCVNSPRETDLLILDPASLPSFLLFPSLFH